MIIRHSNGCIHRGYRLVYVDGKQIPEHRHIFSKYMKRPLLPSEHIHHKNGNKADNRIENLEILDRSKHTIIHNTGRYRHTGTNKTHKYCPSCKRIIPRTEFRTTLDKSRSEPESSRCRICLRHREHNYVLSCPICLGILTIV